MAESAEFRIQRMNLSILPTAATDEVIDDDDYNRRFELYDYLKSSDIAENKPQGAIAPFEITEDNGDIDYRV